MKTKYKYIHMKKVNTSVEIRKAGDKNIWNIFNNKSNEVLGGISWYAPWRQYCFYAKEGCIFNSGCLADIQDFIKQLMN